MKPIHVVFYMSLSPNTPNKHLTLLLRSSPLLPPAKTCKNKKDTYSGVLLLPGNVLLSREEASNYHRRKR
ncbi:hypothetical protein ACTHP3_20425, partial [Shouchella rhizosphaerae]|uniref:hypothetical protein n=1 Tax=Shouchella rhizosphaerae TaxID=866786 RepID=UPI003F81F762